MPSSVIRSFAYHSARRELEITFQTGRHYVYEDVPPEIYDAMRKAFSKGEFFNEHIRDRYSFTRKDVPLGK
jgi:KTSC domain-containing protein